MLPAGLALRPAFTANVRLVVWWAALGASFRSARWRTHDPHPTAGPASWGGSKSFPRTLNQGSSPGGRSLEWDGGTGV